MAEDSYLTVREALQYIIGKIKAGFVRKRTFNSTPVFTVTLAEATTATNASRYTITAEQLGGSYQELYIHMAVPLAAKASTGRLLVIYANGESKLGQISNAIYTAARYVLWRVRNECGMAEVWGASGSGSAAPYVYANTSSYDPKFCGDSAITKLEFWLTTSGATEFPAGTVIRIFAAS